MSNEPPKSTNERLGAEAVSPREPGKTAPTGTGEPVKTGVEESKSGSGDVPEGSKAERARAMENAYGPAWAPARSDSWPISESCAQRDRAKQAAQLNDAIDTTPGVIPESIARPYVTPESVRRSIERGTVPLNPADAGTTIFRTSIPSLESWAALANMLRDRIKNTRANERLALIEHDYWLAAVCVQQRSTYNDVLDMMGEDMEPLHLSKEKR